MLGLDPQVGAGHGGGGNGGAERASTCAWRQAGNGGGSEEGSNRSIEHPIGGRLRASTLHEVRGDKPRVVWVEGLV
jgi:hypothetical protein